MSILKQIGFSLLVIGSLSSSASAAVVVETFSATETYTFVLPGTPDGSGGLDFDYTQSFTAINFTPGDLTFQGQPVDFSGTEADFLATSQNGTVNIPVSSGPATVTATGTSTTTGPALVGTDIPIELVALSLGGSFSPTNLDIVSPSFTSLYVSGTDLGTVSLTVPVIPELDGIAIEYEGTSTVTSVNPSSGTFTVTTTGSFLASPNNIPTLSQSGLILLGLLFLLAMFLTIRRRGLPGHVNASM